MSEISMPRLSDTMQEGTISRWLKQPGDEVKKGDVLAEIETDKATMDLEAYESGTLEKILVQGGETVPIGQPVAVIGSGSGAQSAGAQPAQQPAQEPSPAPASARAATEEAPATPEPAAESKEQAPAAESTSAPQRVSETAERSDGASIKVSPLARRMAEEHNIDLRQLQGTGPGGRIVRDDIEDYLEHRGPTPSTATPEAAPAAPPQEAPAAAQAAAPAARPEAGAPPPDAEVVKLSRVQVLIARRLTESKQTIPHFYVSSEVDMTDVLAMRQTFNASAGEDGVKVTVNDLIVKACALALEKFPEVNSSLKDDQLIKYKRIHVGIAVDVPSGLVVPVIRDTNIKGVRSIAREAKELIAKARANKLSTTDLEGGTFSVSNLGMMDASNFIAVINPPQAAILAVASARKQFVPVDGQPVARDMMTMTMSADHRIIYGATVARFLQEVKRLLHDPYSLLG
ncbi:MAG TPA: dihydrolipoamide acetyltransferase family protein [Ktedonobacteraceae bacterium]